MRYLHVLGGAVALVLVAPAPSFAAPPVIAFTSPTTVDEGREVLIEVEVSDPDGDAVTWSWDLDDDRTFGELPGAASYVVPAGVTDGPSSLRIGVQASDGTEERTVYRTITVNNVAPTITSYPLTEARVRREYRYEPTVDDPAGESDVPEVLLLEGPDGMEVAGTVITWTPTPAQRATSYPVEIVVRDGDGGEDEQQWMLRVPNNTTPEPPTPMAPIGHAQVDADAPVTLTVENGRDDDEDPLQYFFRLSQSARFDGARVIRSDAIEEGSDGTTSWTTPEALAPGPWYWQVWVEDGIEESSPRFAHLLVGTGDFPDGGTPPRFGDGGLISGPDPDAPSSGGCSVASASGEGGAGLHWLAGLLALGLLLRRRRHLGAAAMLAAALTVAGCTTTGQQDDAGIVPGEDSDGDGISDEDEGAFDRIDTDGDGLPDYLDVDSDGDGIPDRLEAGDDDLESSPRDSDGDGVPDFRDLDSDGNGIPDELESQDDNDGDGIPDYADLDDDDDGVSDADELAGIVNPPVDTDNDGVPNFKDPDSDGDTILDGHEWGEDTDGDGLRDWEDQDSDNDGIPDLVEAGDTDLGTSPVDTDGDGIPDYRDTDSDNDGLSDRWENENGTDPILEDSDGDGVSDLIEVGAETDPLDGSVSPRTRGDFVFVVPFEEEPTPTRDTLHFRTSLQLVDIYFLFDATTSMNAEIDNLRTKVGVMMSNLICEDFGTTCVSDADCSGDQVCSVGRSCIEDPTVSGCVANPWTGGGFYESELDHFLSVQPDPAMTAAALNQSTYGATEALYRGVWSLVDPSGPFGALPMGCAAPMPGRIGCAGYRTDAAKILVVFTDDRNYGSETAAQAGAALQYAGVTMIGVYSGSQTNGNRQALVDLALESGSLDGAGQPLVFDTDTDGTGVDEVVEDAIKEIVGNVPLRVTIAQMDEPDDAGNALQFIDHVEINGADVECEIRGGTEDTDGDGLPDAFPSLLPGTPVCWDVVPRKNTTVEPTEEPLVFRARLTVSGDGSPLDSRLVYFLVPPVIPPPDIIH